jgi:hypothetical protein
VQDVRLAVKRPLADRGDEAFDRGIIDLIGLNPLGAGIAGETREAEMGALARKLSHQTGPGGTQRRLARALHGLQSADLHGGEESGAQIGQGLGADPRRDRVDAPQLGADRRQIERDAGRFVPQQAGDPLYRRVQVSQPGSGERGLLLQGNEEVRQGGRRRIPKPGFHPLIKPVRRVEGDPAGVTEDRPAANNGELGKPARGAGSAPSLPDVLSGGLAAKIPWRIHRYLTTRVQKARATVN